MSDNSLSQDPAAKAWVSFNNNNQPPRRSASGPIVHFHTVDDYAELPTLRAYIDETGDRGTSEKSSKVFGMAAVIVDSDAENDARAVLRTLRTDFKTPEDRELSWKNDVKTEYRRLHAAKLLSEIGSGIQVVYVVDIKKEMRDASFMQDMTLAYNFTAFQLLKRIVWASKYWQSGPHQVRVRYGTVKGHDPADTHRYFQLKKTDGTFNHEYIAALKWVNARAYEMSQVADLYAGFLHAAFEPNRQYGDVNGVYLSRIWHQIREVKGCVLNLGLMPSPRDDLAGQYEWWPCKDCNKARKEDAELEASGGEPT